MSVKHKTSVYTSTNGGKRVKMGWVSHESWEEFLDVLIEMAKSLKEEIREDREDV